MQALRDRPVLARVTLAQGFYGGGLVAAIPLYALVYVDRLDLSLGDVGMIGVLAAVSTTVSFMVWGEVVDRRGSIVALRFGSVLGLTSLVIYAVAPNVAFLWIAAVAGGAAGASIDVGWAAIVSEHTSLASRSAAIAGMNALTGARGIAPAFAMSALLQLGILDVTAGLVVCSIATGIGVVLYARTDVTALATSPALSNPAPVAVRERIRRRLIEPAAGRLLAPPSRHPSPGLTQPLRWRPCDSPPGKKSDSSSSARPSSRAGIETPACS